MITTVFGPPGCGKTTYLVREICKIRKKYKDYKIFCNFPVNIPNVYKINTRDIGTFDISHSFVIIDEAGIDISNRDWKKFPKETMEFLKLHRHYDTHFVFVSQAWDDLDKKVRDLSERYILLKKAPFGLTLTKKIFKSSNIDDISKQIIDFYRFRDIWDIIGDIIFNPRSFFFIRRPYYRYFDSWNCPPLPEKTDLQYWKT